MKSPYPHEVEVASSMLLSLLAEHSMSMRDLGLSSTDVVVVSPSGAKTVSPCIKRPDPRRIYNEFEDLIDINYWKIYSTLDRWEQSLITELSIALGIEMHQSSSYTKFVGYSSDIKLFKKLLVHFTHHIEGLIKTRSFSCAGDKNEFAMGFFMSVLARVSIATPNNQAKLEVIRKYLRMNYSGYRPSEQYTVHIDNRQIYQEGSDMGRYYQMDDNRPRPTYSNSTTVTVSKPGTPSRRF